MKNPRYDGKPLLRLVELWVLWVIDEIDAQDVARLTEMEPKLRQTWSLDGAWHEMIEELLQLSPAMRNELRAMWQRNLETARQQGVPAPTEVFSQSIADQIAGNDDCRERTGEQRMPAEPGIHAGTPSVWCRPR